MVCFRRPDSPWPWSGKRTARDDVNPWKGRTQTRGLEFGSTPMPYPRKEAFAQGLCLEHLCTQPCRHGSPDGGIPDVPLQRTPRL